MVTVQAVTYAGGVGEMINSPISIILHRRSKYNQLKMLTQYLEELISTRSYIQLPLILTLLKVVKQGLIQIQDQGILHLTGCSDIGCLYGQ